MSIHGTIANREETGRVFGRFKADVSLKMEFRSSAKLSGTISGFQGSAVDSGRSVDLSRNNQAFGWFVQ